MFTPHSFKVFSAVGTAVAYGVIPRDSVENAARQHLLSFPPPTSSFSSSLSSKQILTTRIRNGNSSDFHLNPSNVSELSILSEQIDLPQPHSSEEISLLIPSKDTIDKTIDIIASKPEIYQKIFPENYHLLVCKQQISETIEDFLTDSELMENILESIKIIPTKTGKISPCSTREWHSIIGNHKCSTCLDLLAAPCIIECGHSFCGECIDSHINTNKSDEVTHVTCPICRHEINKLPTFERILDEDIADKVSDFPNCSEKRDWIARRNIYKLRKEPKSKKAKSAIFDVDDDEQATETIRCVGFIILMVILIAFASAKKK